MKPVTLVTGGTGFVGRHLLRELASQQIPTRLVVRRDTSRAVPPDLPLDSICETDDLFGESREWWTAVCRGVDTVIHLAWYAEPGQYLLSPLNLDCLKGTLSLAQAAIHAEVRRFVGIGTCFEYAISNTPLSASSPINPTTPYAAAKVAAFMALSRCLPAAAMSFAWCRLFYMYGEGEDHRRLTAAIRQSLARGESIALSSGHQTRDFLDVADVAKRIVTVARGEQAGPINICSGKPTTVRMLAEAIADEFGRRDLLKFGARPDNLIDPPYIVGIPNDT